MAQHVHDGSFDLSAVEPGLWSWVKKQNTLGYLKLGNVICGGDRLIRTNIGFVR
jgi:hypothetical protein